MKISGYSFDKYFRAFVEGLETLDADLERWKVPTQDAQHQKMRDGGRRHITILTPDEVYEIAGRRATQLRSKNRTLGTGRSIQQALAYLKDKAKQESMKFGEPQILGLGYATASDGQTCHFYVVEWPKVQEFRTSLELGPLQFHITVAYSSQDIFGVEKGRNSLLS